MVTQNEVYADCDKVGADEVRKQLNGNAWGNQRKQFAKGWLASHSESRKDASSSEQIRIARSAKNAAIVAAIAAIIANIVAAISLYISFTGK